MKRKAIEIKDINGVSHNLVFDLNAMVELEDLYGDIDKAFEAMNKGSFKAIRALIWAGLLHENADLTIHDVGALLQTQDLVQLGEVIKTAMGEDMLQPEDLPKLPN